MSTAPQLAPIADAPAPNSHGGPRTEEGKAASAQNAIKYGLFAARDFIRPGEQPLYDELAESLQTDLFPIGALEQNLVNEIRRAMWRMQRCGEIEAGLALKDPADEGETAKLQLAVDRARALSHRLLHKCTAELRALQTERQFRNNFFEEGTDISDLGICNCQAVRKGIEGLLAAQFRRKKLIDRSRLDDLLTPTYPPQPAKPGSLCKEQPQTPRNAECPCKSGLKYKRCCGKDAPAVLHAA